MRRMIPISLSFAVLAFCAVSPVDAQEPGKKGKSSRVSAAAKPMPQGTTRVAIINLGYVFQKYERAATIKEEMQSDLKRLGDEAKKHVENVKIWQAALQANDFKDATKEQYEEKLILARRRLEDLDRTARTKYGKVQQSGLVTLWNDVHEAVKTYAAAQGIDLVMAYGEPLGANDAMAFPNIDRKLRGTEQGGAVPFLIGPGVDISDAIVELLNKRYRDEKGKATEEGASEER